MSRIKTHSNNCVCQICKGHPIKKEKQKYYSNHYDGPCYTVNTKPDYGGSTAEFKTFREAKAYTISNVLGDIEELKGTLKMLRELKKKDVTDD